MVSIYKNDIGNIVMVFTDESRIQLKGTLANILEEMRIVASGDVVTNVDVEKCSEAIADLQMLFGELLEQKEEKIVNAVTANANKYLENTIETENGTIYRKEDWENADPDEIIYIGEFGLTELDKLIEEGKNPTDAELIEQNIASSKNSIRAEIKQYYPEATDEWIDKHDLIADIMEFASWEYTATVVDQIDEWDIWDDYPEK